MMTANRLPSEYQGVEYLESKSDNAEWINTGIIPNKNMRVVVHGMTCDNITDASFFFGSRVTSNSCMFCGLIWRRYYQFELGNRRNVNIAQAHAKERFFYDFNCDENHSVIANGTAYVNSITITDEESQYDTPMLLFAIYTGRTIDSQRRPVRISSFTVYESYTDANPIQNLVSCYRIADSKPGMYDTVSKTFYTNSGTGEFLVGADV